MEKLLLSVVIPIFNGQKHIRDCLAAIVNQTYENLEIICVDDGSTDNSAAICKEFAERDSRIKLFTQENKGASSARNAGMDKATGEYVCFCDADDYPESEWAQRYVAAIENWKDADCSFICCGMYFDNVYYKNVKNKESILEAAHGFVRGNDYLISRATAATLAWLKLFNFVTNKCYDLNLIKEKNIRFDEGVNIGEDLKFNLDYLDNTTGNIGMINQALYHYVRRCGDSLSLTYHPNDLEDTKYIYKRLVNWEMRQPGCTEENMLVVKGIYISDWVSRITSMYEAYREGEAGEKARQKVTKELKCKEFQDTLKEIYAGKKISTLRYVCLRTGIFQVFYFFRGIYQLMKG